MNSAALYILARVAWRTCTEVSAERISGSRTAVSERARLSRFNVECQVVVQSDLSSVEGGVPCSGPPQDMVESKVFISPVYVYCHLRFMLCEMPTCVLSPVVMVPPD